MDREDVDIRRVEREKVAAERFEIFRAEEAGALSGRMGFRSSDPRDPRHNHQRQSSKQQAALTALDLALADPGYRALYTDTLDMLHDAEIRTAQALERAQDGLRAAQAKLQDTLDGAARLYPDNVAVFRDKDGNVYTEHGALLTAEQAESIVWPDDAPAHEDFLADKQAVDDGADYVERLRDYQTNTLGSARDTVDTSRANGQKIDEDGLSQIQDDIQSGLANLSVQNQLSPPSVGIISAHEVTLPPPS